MHWLVLSKFKFPGITEVRLNGDNETFIGEVFIGDFAIYFIKSTFISTLKLQICVQ